MALVDKIRRIARSGFVVLAALLALALVFLSLYVADDATGLGLILHTQRREPQNLAPGTVDVGPEEGNGSLRSNFTILTIVSVLLDLLEPTPEAEIADESYLLRTYPQGLFAVLSWLSLPATEVILFGTPFTCKVFLETILKNRPHAMCLPVPCDQDGVPTVDCIFATAAARAGSEFLAYVNADILLYPDFLAAVEHVGHKVDHFMLVGKRRNANMTSIIPVDLLQLSGIPKTITSTMAKELFRISVGHDRNGIDFFVFRSKHVMSLRIPPFMVGRVQWDQWLLLMGITFPNMTTIEASDVVQAIHFNHGGFKASHARAGTEHNKNLALNVPHPYVQDLKIYHPGTIWLGRLDETDYVLVSNAGRDETRISETYFASAAEGPRGTCPECWMRPNNQSLEVLLYRQHTLVQDRRALVLIPVPVGTSLSRVADWFCTATQRGIHNILFVTNTAAVARELNFVGLPAFHHLVKDFEHADIFHTICDFAFAVLYKGYNVLLITLQDLLLVDVNRVLSTDMGLDIQGVPTGDKALSFFPSYIKSRGRTYRFWNLLLLRLKDRVTNEHTETFELDKQLLTIQDEFGRLVENNDPVNGPQIGHLDASIFPSIQSKPLTMSLQRCLWANQGMLPKWFHGHNTQQEDDLAKLRAEEPIKCLAPKVELSQADAMIWRC